MTVIDNPPALNRPRSPMLGLIVVGLLLAALNLRTAVTSIGPVLSEIQNGLSMSSTVAGVLTTLPVICFAALGGLTPALVRRFGDRSVLLMALLAMAVGLIVRACVSSVAVFLLASGFALAGGAVGNVAIPTIVKHHFPDRVGALTTAYSAALAVGAMLAASLTVPLENLTGEWRWALGLWAVLAVVAMLPWLFLPKTERATTPTTTDDRIRGVARSRLGWMTMIAFGTQSIIAYVMFGWLPEMMRGHGYSAAQAGVMLGVFTAISIPISIIIPVMAARRPTQHHLLVVLCSSYFVGLPAMWLGGYSIITWIGLVLVAVAMGTFPLLLTLFVLRTRTSAGTAALSGFAQGGGYLLAAAGPLLVGILYDATGDWSAAFVILLVTAAVHMVAGWTTVGDRFIEDEVPGPAAG